MVSTNNSHDWSCYCTWSRSLKFPTNILDGIQIWRESVKICLCEGLWFRQLQLVVMILFITRLEKVSNCQSSVPGEMGSRFLALEMKPPLLGTNLCIV